ncbi:MAG: ABC transporter substrate-binding protein, partial [Vibrio litoralis]|uniref:ABC transporter substrate-binding protein n=1 Tax=Vibrio litoralis TaxID=335972 RepID=UPI003F98D807
MKKTLSLLAVGISLAFSPITQAKVTIGEPEKEDLTFGFIKLTDMAPLAVAYEKHYFEDEGLYVCAEHGVVLGGESPLRAQ